MINILICDDDFYTGKVMKKVIEEHPQVKEIYLAKDGEEAVDIVKKYNIDLAFMDIDMPIMDGLEAAKLIKGLNENLKIVFVTAYQNYACESYEIRAYDYILKPIDFLRVKENLERIIEEHHGDKFEESLKENLILMIKDKQNYFLINMEEINYIEKDNKELIIHTHTKKFTTRASLGEIEKKLTSFFLRTHKSYIVNLKNIEKIEPYGDSSYVIFFKNTDETKNALITKDKIHLLKG
ncbi:LytR/AlgR family response regulator transcription factor [Alkaliphilus hydrothermalis]|uniref:Stage 0 sporulation protein A homolog n=1 Tax=Alkaliphilus hydrothermalis TaxID=1482730 RepID=A0ABS2NV05_9FIRM|nr:LytTR family DNA-binding domain-containing protein [Alkaliphilus hydrothermalis]MBM7616404.1 two-component system LytT family response regulator [Alkaliphilus hydrothermalis]